MSNNEKNNAKDEYSLWSWLILPMVSLTMWDIVAFGRKWPYLIEYGVPLAVIVIALWWSWAKRQRSN